MISNSMPANTNSAFCHPVPSISATPNGANRNWPNEPAAVHAPTATLRQRSGISLPNAGSTRLNEQPDKPNPISAPAVRYRVLGVAACAISASPAAYRSPPAESTRTVPKRSAMAPAKGWPMPHRRFWIAKANAKTSRPQPFCDDIGLRNSPNDERGPNPSRAMRHPHRRMTNGVRQPSRAAVAGIEVIARSPPSREKSPLSRTALLPNPTNVCDRLFCEPQPISKILA
jgi:hypothetical protein